MADKRISELTALTGANVADTDLLPIVDTSATETKKITFGEFKTALDTATGFVRITGDTMTGNLSLGDNNKAIFGAGSDLQIYHDGSNSYIDDAGTGGLILRADNAVYLRSTDNENMVYAEKDGPVNLYHNNSKKLATTATGIDVNGTVVADGLNVQTTNGLNAVLEGTTAYQYLQFKNSGQTENYLGFVNNDFTVTAANNKYLQVNGNGDISFYEDTGTTAKFFWDASAESLGIGTTTGTETLSIKDNAGFQISFGNTSASSIGAIGYDNNDKLNIYGSGATRMVIDSSGNVGIGTSSPNAGSSGTQHSVLTVKGSGSLGNGIFELIQNGTSGNGQTLGDIKFFDSTNHNVSIEALRDTTTSSGLLTFKTRAPAGALAERMRIDSSGNVLHTVASQGSAFVANTPSTWNALEIFQDRGVTNSASGIAFRSQSGTAPAGIVSVAGNTTGGIEGLVFMTSTGNNTYERMRIDSSGNLLVGTTDPLVGSGTGNNTQGLALSAGSYGGYATFSRSGSECLNLNRIASDGTILNFRKDGTTVGSIGSSNGSLKVSSADTGLIFGDAFDEIYPTSNGITTLGDAGARFKDLYLSGGVYLGGTVAANLLNDYEEGTYEVVLTPSTSGSLTVGVGANTGAYTKVGQLVTITGNITVTSVSSPVGAYVDISLPFPISAKTDQAERFGSAFTFYDNSSTTFSTEPMQAITGSVVRIHKDAATWAANDQVYFSFSYTTDS